MNKFKSAYEAACALAELAEVYQPSNGFALAIANITNIVSGEIDNVPFGDVRFDKEMQKRLQHISDLSYYISAACFSLANDQGLVEEKRIRAQFSVLFRCVTDMCDDMEDKERHDWSNPNHWQSAANAARKLYVLREEQEELQDAA